MTFRDDLARIQACEPAIKWVGKKTLEEAWATCERADWMVWLLFRIHDGGPWSDNRKRLMPMLCEIVREALPTFEKVYPDDKRPRNAIETLEAWARGEATQEEVERAARSAWAASASDTAARSASASVAWAATAARSAWAASASDTAAWAASASAAWAATAAMATWTTIVRKHFPTFPQPGEVL
jgi:hypothetical protein